MDTNRVQTRPLKYWPVVLIALLLAPLFTQTSVAEKAATHRYEIDLSSSVTSMQDGMIQMGQTGRKANKTASKDALSDDQAELKMALDNETGNRVIATRVIETKYKEDVLIDTQINSIASTYSLTEQKHFRRLRTIFWASSNFSRLQSTIYAINNDERFEYAKLQIIDHINTQR